MREQHNDKSLAPARVKCGRAVLIGYGLDDAGGHVRYTQGDAMKLYGGSKEVHDEMCRRAMLIQEEAARLGISMERMTHEQYLVMRDVIDRVNCEPFP
ncbi:MAG: hypothetical protein LBS30_03100 [Planctomycetota bacterium]|nr:hypothetical protein [Planctomycetota bacterium]